MPNYSSILYEHECHCIKTLVVFFGGFEVFFCTFVVFFGAFVPIGKNFGM